MTQGQRTRGKRKVRRGTVLKDRMDKTVVVRVERTLRHPEYEKVVKLAKKHAAHDEKNEARVGDMVEIMETRPYSKTKHWRLVRIIKQARRTDEEGPADEEGQSQ